jgi:hypothetical protein
VALLLLTAMLAVMPGSTAAVQAQDEDGARGTVVVRHSDAQVGPTVRRTVEDAR